MLGFNLNYLSERGSRSPSDQLALIASSLEVLDQLSDTPERSDQFHFMTAIYSAAGKWGLVGSSVGTMEMAGEDGMDIDRFVLWCCSQPWISL